MKAGKYRIIKKDSLNVQCYFDIEIKSPKKLILSKDSIVSIKPVKEKSNGSLTINFSGGTPPYTLLFNRIDTKIPQSLYLGNSTTKIVDALSSGIYTIMVQDSSECQSVALQYELPDKNNFDYSIVQLPKTCDSAGVFKINISKGMPPYDVQVKLNNQIVFFEFKLPA